MVSKTPAVEFLSDCCGNACFEALLIVPRHACAGLEFEEGAQSFGLEDWARLLAAYLGGIDRAVTFVAIEASAFEVQLGD